MMEGERIVDAHTAVLGRSLKGKLMDRVTTTLAKRSLEALKPWIDRSVNDVE